MERLDLVIGAFGCFDAYCFGAVGRPERKCAPSLVWAVCSELAYCWGSGVADLDIQQIQWLSTVQ